MAKAYSFNDKIWTAASQWVAGFPCRIFRATSGGTVFSSNLANTAGHDIFTDTFVVNDAMYFGQQFLSGKKFRNLYFHLDTAMAATSYTLAWEYYNGAWVALSVTDNTSNFTVLGSEQSVLFAPPSDWRPVAVNAQTGFWVRVRVTAVTTPTEGGKMTTTEKVTRGNNTLTFTGDTAGTDDVTLDNLYQWAEVSGPSAPLGIITRLHTGTAGHRAYEFDCNLMVGISAIDSATAKDGFFNDKDVYIEFTNYHRLMSYRDTNRVTLGNEEISSDLGDRGCDLRYNIRTGSSRMQDWIYGIVSLYDLRWLVILDDTSITFDNLISWDTVISKVGQTNEILNCTFTALRVLDIYGSASSTFKHINFFRCTRPQIVTTGTQDDINSAACRSGIGMTSTADFTMLNPRVLSQGIFLAQSFAFNNVATWTNADIPDASDAGNTRIEWQSANAGSVRVSFTVDVKVLDEFGNPLQGATVEVFPDTTAPTQTLENGNNFSVTTGADGKIAQQTLTSKMYEANPKTGTTTATTITTYTPFRIRVSRPGFVTSDDRQVPLVKADFALLGMNRIVTLVRDIVNLAPEVITLA